MNIRGEKADEAIEQIGSVVNWMFQDIGQAKNSPAEFGFQKTLTSDQAWAIYLGISGFRESPFLYFDGFVKSPSAALRCNFVVAAYV